MKALFIAAALTAGIGLAAGVPAQDYPARAVRVVIGFPPGGAIDVTARTVTQELARLWGRPVIVENRPGAGGSLGAAAVAKSPPDGYTLLVHSNGFAVNPALYATLPYDPVRDLTAVAPLASQPFVLVAAAGSKLKSVADVVSAARARPGQLHYGSAGVGSGTHLVAEKFRLAAGIEAAHVPYKGGPEASADTMAGRIAYWFPPLPFALPQLRDGRLHALGLTSAGRSSLLPNVPTLAESGLPGFEERIWYGMWAPAGTPDAVVRKVAEDIARILAAPQLRAAFEKTGTEPMLMSSGEFDRFVRAEMQSAARLVKAAGIAPQ
jgi:tripartite-type tricarboxylate transporter receptor subunit TctC